MGFQSSDIVTIADQWTKEELGSSLEFWLMIAAESFNKLPQGSKKSVATSVIQRGRLQK